MSDNKILFDRYLLCSRLIVILFAIPLLLFVTVNYDIISEINTAFISIPKLAHFRGDEFTLSPIKVWHNFKRMIYIMLMGNDGVAWSATKRYGLYYPISIVFLLIGVVGGIINDFIEANHTHSKPRVELIMWLWIFFSGLRGLLSFVSANQINLFHISIVYFDALGIYCFCDKFFKTKSFVIISIVYSLFFCNVLPSLLHFL